MSFLLFLAAGSVAPAALTGCQPATSPAASASKPTPPAKVTSPVKEADLSTIKLTPEAENRLGLALVEVSRQPLPRTNTYGGEVIIPTGRLISVASPFNGMLTAPPGKGIPTPGSAVTKGQPLFVLVPILTPESRATMAPLLIESEGQAKQAAEQLKIAKVALDRAENLVRDRLGGNAALVDAKNQYELAQTNLKAAENRRAVLTKIASETEAGSINHQTIEAPASGTIQNVHALVGQTIAAGMILFEVASLDPVWVKVPVYVGDFPRIDGTRPARVGGLADTPGAEAKAARPVAAPPSGDPLAATVNVFYEVENRDGSLRPGERVGVTVPLKGSDESLIVPRAALLRDIHGGAWVYEKVGVHAFARRRVLVDRVVGDAAALTEGPKPGAKVVTDGAAELFGAEFGGAK